LVDEANVDRLVSRVLRGQLGLVVLHSAHWSKPFVRLMQQRAIDDARALIPAAERATAVLTYENQDPYGKVPAADAPLTPALRQENGVWKLTLPGCIFPAYRPDGAPSHVTTLAPDHPVAAGLPRQWDVPHTEMYAEPFHVPTPDDVVFEERWDRGEYFRSGCAWQVGAGRVFYFRPGHETYPVFKQIEPLRVVENAARWAAPHQSVEPVTSPPAAIRFDPVLTDIEGWKVHVDPALLDGGAQRENGARALQMLANHLQRIKVLVPAGPLANLQTIEIWIEHDHPTLRSMQYHPGREWLVEHGHDPRLTRKVHITQAVDLLSREEMLKHPAVILHELAHGYHDQILGFEHPAIIAAYKQAREAGSYANVLLYNGERVSHYALTDHKEYFAEGTEAFFYRNDFYPFVRAELKIHDPSLDTLLESVWGPDASH
jgi:dipeptidyl-peptidase-4